MMDKTNMKNIYWIGGSPCSGKSTISKMIVEKYGFNLYRCDDYLESHLEIGVTRKFPVMSKVSHMTWDEIWMRPIDVQVKEEFEYYREELTLILEDLDKYPKDKNIIVEGAAILPEFIEAMKISNERVVFIVPTSEFQLEHYKKREWIHYLLKDCKDPQKAFGNWMERDIRFANEITEMTRLYGRNLIVTDGSKSIKDNFNTVAKFFELSK